MENRENVPDFREKNRNPVALLHVVCNLCKNYIWYSCSHRAGKSHNRIARFIIAFDCQGDSLRVGREVKFYNKKALHCCFFPLVK